MRLDKFLCEMNIGTRSEVKAFLKQGHVTVNNSKVTRPEVQINEENDLICFKGTPLKYSVFEYYMLNKPQGCVTATEDKRDKTVMEYLPAGHRSDVFPVGRLDKDTEGLLLLTNDGDLAHRLLSPKKHVDKTYLVDLDHSLTLEETKQLEEGVDIGEKALTRPAKVMMLNDTQMHLTIQEGKFHQVKRMLQAVGNKVVHLKRITFGALTLDPALAPGDCRSLTDKEIKSLYEP